MNYLKKINSLLDSIKESKDNKELKLKDYQSFINILKQTLIKVDNLEYDEECNIVYIPSETII